MVFPKLEKTGAIGERLNRQLRVPHQNALKITSPDKLSSRELPFWGTAKLLSSAVTGWAILPFIWDMAKFTAVIIQHKPFVANYPEYQPVNH